MRLSVVAVQMLTPHVKSIRLALADASDLPSYSPGAHIDVSLPLGGGVVQRKYSLVSDPADLRYYEIAVKRSACGRGGSAYLHEAVQVGTVLDVGRPANEFKLRTEAAQHVFIAGGIGITPLLCMARQAAQQGAAYELHYVAPDPEEMAFRSVVTDMPGAKVYYSRGEESMRLDIPGVLGVHAANPDVHLYVCGPGRLIDAVRWQAEHLGFHRSRIHFESFGPVWMPGDGTVNLRLSASGIALSVFPSVTLLDALEEAGAWIPSECKRGECGTCVTSYTSGVVLHRDNCLTEEQRRHVFCPCVSWALGDTPLSLPL